MNTSDTLIRSTDFGRVRVFFGHRSGKYPDGNQILIHGSDTRAAFDTPIVANHIGAEFDATEIVLMGHVHEDHMAGLHRLPHAQVHVHHGDVQAARSWEGMCAALGMPVQNPLSQQLLKAFQQDFFYAPRPDAQPYDDGAVWDLGQARVRAFHMPGHTAGHTVLVEETEGVAFIGDIDLTGFGPYYGDASSSLSDFRRTLARLPQVPAQVWVTSHHRGIYTDRQAFLHDLASFTAKIDERDNKLLDWIRQAPKTIADMTGMGLLYPVGASVPWAKAAETRTIKQHLTELAAAGMVAADEAQRYHYRG